MVSLNNLQDKTVLSVVSLALAAPAAQFFSSQSIHPSSHNPLQQLHAADSLGLEVFHTGLTKSRSKSKIYSDDRSQCDQSPTKSKPSPNETDFIAELTTAQMSPPLHPAPHLLWASSFPFSLFSSLALPLQLRLPLSSQRAWPPS